MERGKVHVSKMSGKLANIKAINTNNLSNDFCRRMAKNPNTMCAHCYANRNLKGYRKACVPAFEHNSKMLSRPLGDNIPKFKSGEKVRFNGYGELVNEIHLHNIINIARLNPDTFFALWSKRKDLIRQYFDVPGRVKPKNLNIIYSSPILNKRYRVPKYHDKVFTVYDKNTIEEKCININCGAKDCNSCNICYSKNRVSYVNEKLK